MNGRAAVAGSTPGRPGYRGRSGNLTAAGRRARLLREVGEAAWTARDLFPDLRLDASGRRNPRRSRAELVAEIARLAAEGSTQKEIAVILGISHSYVRDLRYDPDGSKQRERKDSYRGVCQECGASTDGSNGPGNAPELCSTCSRAKKCPTCEDYAAFLVERTGACRKCTLAAADGASQTASG